MSVLPNCARPVPFLVLALELLARCHCLPRALSLLPNWASLTARDARGPNTRAKQPPPLLPHKRPLLLILPGCLFSSVLSTNSIEN